jgi:hypothetical protein
MKRPIKEVEYIKDTIQNLEQMGCVVMAPEDLDKDIESLNAIREKQKEQNIVRQKKIKEESFMALDLWSFDPEELLDSIVPACCKHECMVEPDGYCLHILLTPSDLNDILL